MNDLHTALRTKERADGTLWWGGPAGIGPSRRWTKRSPTRDRYRSNSRPSW
jgi:hypothetical protein